MLQATGQAPSGSDEKKLIPPAPEVAENAITSQRRISLDVVATDSSGKALSGLEQQDFTILDNNQPQKMTSFEALQGTTADPPVEVILLIDLVNTGFSRVAYERQEIDKFLRQNNGKLAYPTTIVVFTDTGTQIQPQPSRDGNAMADLLDSTNSALRVIGRSAGFYGAQERLQTSFTAMDRLISYEGTKQGRKMVLWLSPGWPLLSGPNVEFSSKDQQSFFSWIANFSNALRTSRMTLYAIDPVGAGDGSMLRTFYYESFLKGVKSSKQAGPGNLALQVLATQSGGRVLNSSNDLLGEINSCVADASAYYSMSFDSAPSDHVNEYHPLTVKVDKPGVKTRTNAAYYGQP
ncbi:VWA domain-containing protein [Alloacidobacterium dinghuense]|uniref:VWA domain-containing protein n=1 Tax=Alloacidobacterium dinghuense TaxID=2763107 RepID=A0A7G8BQ51_9BACT|nr:VWA domain-containing protein [Alloacidobacterium dinghuense]QNI34671.1 VWA domain-containing protein [Alloacidobacterium dinghuense]